MHSILLEMAASQQQQQQMQMFQMMDEDGFEEYDNKQQLETPIEVEEGDGVTSDSVNGGGSAVNTNDTAKGNSGS